MAANSGCHAAQSSWDMQYWIIENGESKGPFSLEELKAQNISPQTKIWHKGLENWTPLNELPLLHDIFPPIEETPDNATQDRITNEACVKEMQPPAYVPPVIPPQRPHNFPLSMEERMFNAYRQGYEKGLEEGKQLDKDTDTGKCPPTNLVWAILSTVLCCLPLGIVAIVYASKVTNLYYQGEFLKAQKASDRALYWSLASLITHLVTYPILSTLSLFLI